MNHRQRVHQKYSKDYEPWPEMAATVSEIAPEDEEEDDLPGSRGGPEKRHTAPCLDARTAL